MCGAIQQYREVRALLTETLRPLPGAHSPHGRTPGDQPDALPMPICGRERRLRRWFSPLAPYLGGLAAALTLVGLYLGIISAAASFQHALEQFRTDAVWVTLGALGLAPRSGSTSGSVNSCAARRHLQPEPAPERARAPPRRDIPIRKSGLTGTSREVHFRRAGRARGLRHNLDDPNHASQVVARHVAQNRVPAGFGEGVGPGATRVEDG